MNKTISTSDSLITSLCIEIEYIKKRYNNINISLASCRDKLIRQRLLHEIIDLKTRINEIRSISKEFKESSITSISKLFLYEICHRPIELI